MMYPTKISLFTINFVLTVCSILTIIHGINIADKLPDNLAFLLRTSRTLYYSRIFIAGGTFQLAVSMFGFWSIDAENRAGLFSYKVLIIFMMLLEGIAISEDYIYRNETEKELKIEVEKSTFPNLNKIQSYLHCCHRNVTTRDPYFAPKTCCPADIIFAGKKCEFPGDTFKAKCPKTVHNFYQRRRDRYMWFILRLIFTQLAAVVFAHLFSKHLRYMRNLVASLNAH